MNTIFSMEDIFRGRLFKVPDYQRGYTWDQKNWQDLIEDLELLSEGRNHFTGTLVLRSVNHTGSKIRDESGATYSLFDIIDGQQRLTTVVLLLDNIHDEMERLGLQKLATGLEKAYLTVKDLAGQVHTRLTLNRDCQDFYYGSVLGFSRGISGPQIRSHLLLQEAHDYFAGYLTEQCAARNEGYADWLTNEYFKVTQHLHVLLYEVESDTDAGVIFETMNDRGKPLTELEKVKNYLLYLSSRLDLPAPHTLAQKVNATWTQIFEMLMAAGLGDTDNENQLLRMHWLMAYDYNPKNWDSSRSIKAAFSLRDYQGKHPALLADVLEYLESLGNATRAYCEIRRPNRSGMFNDIRDARLRREITELSEKLARLGARVNFLPLLMAVRLKSQDDGTAYRKMVELCEKADFRLYQWIGYRSSAAQSTFFRYGYDYYQRPDLARLLAAVTRTATDYCSNDQFAERFDRTTENWYAWGGLKYFLYEYEQHLAQLERMRPQYAWEELSGAEVKRDTIEHILPQSLEDSYWKRRFTTKKHQRWVHDIGNLTLTYDNSSLGAKSFLKKKDTLNKPCYVHSKLYIEQELASHSDWTEDHIKERREKIRVWAQERWSIIAPAAREIDVEETPEERLVRQAEDNGVQAGFLALLQAGRDLAFYIRFQRNWGGVSFNPLSSKTTTLFWVGPDLYIYIGFDMIEKHYRIPAEQVKHILGEEQRRWLGPDEVDEFIAGMKRLFDGIQVNGEEE